MEIRWETHRKTSREETKIEEEKHAGKQGRNKRETSRQTMENKRETTRKQKGNKCKMSKRQEGTKCDTRGRERERA